MSKTPTFDELMPELLKYNSEQMAVSWKTTYEQNPGWLMEPYGLVYAILMYEPSLNVLEKSEDHVTLEFSTYMQVPDPDSIVSSRIMTVDLMRSDEQWKIDSVSEEVLA
ncbi:hypothetical protein [Paenibacillus sp. L3-i20]|uniref:hypothetical protein n=1 Tax=Paenibacillus sp. L3-i20 TaxID=2905833 RepID=UPI0020BD8735|nr:hypothetical protein [Paenibacillus sp. L3-i20]